MLRTTVELSDALHATIDLERPIDLTLPVTFDGPQPGAFNLPDARETPVRMGRFVGAVAQGGSVNCMELSLFPHGNGTHTECASHVARDRHVSMASLALPPLIGATLLSVTPEALSGSAEHYDGTHEAGDRVVTAASLRRSLGQLPARELDEALHRALVIRTHPNPPSRRHQRHGGQNPPYPTREAITWLVELGVEHVLLDLPSLDREHDGANAPNHRRFFGLDDSGALARPRATVTELVYVPDDDDAVPDGAYLLALHCPAIDTDAVPSRAVLYRVIGPARETFPDPA